MNNQLAQADFLHFDELENAIPSLRPIFRFNTASGTVAGQTGEIISFIIPFLFVAGGLLLFIYLIIGGFQMMVSAGNEKGLSEAKGKITNALIGFLLLFVSFWLTQIIGFVLGIKIF